MLAFFLSLLGCSLILFLTDTVFLFFEDVAGQGCFWSSRVRLTLSPGVSGVTTTPGAIWLSAAKAELDSAVNFDSGNVESEELCWTGLVLAISGKAGPEPEACAGGAGTTTVSFGCGGSMDGSFKQDVEESQEEGSKEGVLPEECSNAVNASSNDDVPVALLT